MSGNAPGNQPYERQRARESGFLSQVRDFLNHASDPVGTISAYKPQRMAIRSGTVLRRRALFEEAVEIIEREFAQPLELDDVARRLATSRRQLQRVFAEVGETSFRAYLAKVRMEHAARLLQNGGTPVREIAQSVGYRQPAQFAKAFRRHHGVSPSGYRGTVAA